ncbi:protein tyrosine phosphatase [Sphingobacterium sp. SRCM116780]|uniref:low molecular weight protein tyrosine phosphatase family protein n=1 Tax=Sphingobacterium sp. SRCM116780 TaxID=2907623 RepID=UPI001F2B284C|nr:protein tyrosine phosphatase [Sphingobacterium sp. SRCM116780]UIR55022.1 protein tyrosine phosphatase [Sphingobacterium sp. SRCM116780]
MQNILFICSRNRWRSLTAETIYKNHPSIKVKSAGTESNARIKVNAKHLTWADRVFVMEKHHKEKLITQFPVETKALEIVTLEIPDQYKFMDKDLIEELESSVSWYFEEQ